MKQGDYFSDYFKQKRRDEDWREANKEDITRRVVAFKRAYGKIVQEHRLQIDGDGSGTWFLFDIDQKVEVSEF